MKKRLLCLLILISLFIYPNLVSARVTPEDIINSQRADYNQRVRNYSPQSKQKLDLYSQKIADLNKKVTDDWEANMVRQGEILDEYLRRNNFKETEGIKNARYWLTYAHEAVAYQAAKIYIFDLTGEASANSNIISEINVLQSDLNILRGKVIKSQNIIADLVK